MDARTLRAAVLADAIAFAAIAGIGLFLGFSLLPTLIAAAVVGTFSFVLILGAARRAESFQPGQPGQRPPGTADHLASGHTPAGAPDIPPAETDDDGSTA